MSDYKFKVGDRVRHIAYDVLKTDPSKGTDPLGIERHHSLATVTSQVSLQDPHPKHGSQNLYQVTFDNPRLTNSTNWYEWAWELVSLANVEDKEMQEAYDKWAKFFSQDN